MNDGILPPLKPIPGLEIKNVWDIFTDEELAELRTKLREMAEQRRRSEALAFTQRCGL